MALMAFLQEPFTGTATPTGWVQFTGGSATIAYSSQGVQVNFPATTSSSTDGDVSSSTTFDLTGSFARINVLSVSGSPATHTDNILRLKLDGSNNVEIFYEAGTLFFSQVVGGSQTNLASTAYDATAHAWWQIRHKGATIYFETSVDGVVWTTQATTPTPFAITALTVLIGGICFGVDTSPNPFSFRYFNYPLPGTTTSTSSTSISSTSTSISSTSTSSTSTSVSSTSSSTSISSTSSSISSTSSSTSSTSSSTSSTSISSTSSSTSVSSTSTSVSSTSTSSTSISSTSSSTSMSTTSTSFSSTSSSISSTSISLSSTSQSSTSSSSSTSTTTLPPPYISYSTQDISPSATGSLIDNFNTNNLNTSLWQTTGSGTPSNQVKNVNNQIEITTTGNSGDYDYLLSIANYNLVGSYVLVKIISAGAQAANFDYLPLILQTGASNQIWWDINGSTLGAFYKVLGVQTSLKTVAYNSSVHVWLRIRELRGSIFWDYSSDGINWINFVSTTAPINVTSVQVGIGTGQFGAASADTSKTDNFNYLPLPLTNSLNAVQYGNESADDGDYLISYGSKIVEQVFNRTFPNNTSNINITWKGRSTIALSKAPMYLQIFNQNTFAWETLSSNTVSPADTDLFLTGSQTTNVSNYYNANNTVTFRIYQQVN